MYDNLKEKYGVTDKEMKEAVDFIAGKHSLGELCNVNVMLAITDLLTAGDIKNSEKSKN